MRKTIARRAVLAAMMVIVAVAAAGMVSAAAKKPDKVQSLQAVSASYQSIKLSWDKAANAKSYEVYRSTKKGSGYTLITTVKGRSYTDQGLDTGTKYWYRVRGVNKDKNGAKSSKVSAAPQLDVPGLTAKSAGEGVILTIDPVEGADGYRLFRDNEKIKTQAEPAYTDTSIAVGSTYTYKACAYRTVGNKDVLSERSEGQEGSRLEVSVKLKNANDVPSPHKQGSGCTIKGTIKSNTTIVKVDVGVRDKVNSQWQKKTHYAKEDVNDMTFSISDADSTVKFGKLEVGSYNYIISVELADGSSKELKNQEFAVEEVPEETVEISYDFPEEVTKGAKNAVKWAVKIANDDSFAYGKGSRAHHGGCYFCGTNVTGIKKAKVGSKWEKTYCCNPFIFAAYAHGAKDKAIKKACKKGKCGGMEPYDWTRYGCFATVGKCKNVPFSKLLPGDVIISNKKVSGQYHHVIMYCGDDKYVEAGWEGWGSSTIGVRSEAKSNYKNHYRKYNSCYVMRYTGE